MSNERDIERLTLTTPGGKNEALDFCFQGVRILLEINPLATRDRFSEIYCKASKFRLRRLQCDGDDNNDCTNMRSSLSQDLCIVNQVPRTVWKSHL
jgi:hypothetical protein